MFLTNVRLNDLMIEKLSFVISILGSIVTLSAILLLQITRIINFPLALFFLLMAIPALFIGILNEELKKIMMAITLSTFGSLTLVIFLRSLPAIVGFIPQTGHVFIFVQIGETLALIGLVFPILILGSVSGIILNAFFLSSPYLSNNR